MLESLLLTQGKIIPPPVKGDITFKTSGATATTVTTSQLGTGFTTQYSIDGADFVTAGASFNIPAGDHTVTLKLDVTTGTSLNLKPFNAILTEVTDWEDFQLPSIRFESCTKLTKVPDYLPVAITDMSYMFRDCTSFNQDIGNWDTSKVTNMYAMFQNCKSFNQDIGGWDVSQVTNMSYMFIDCTSFNQDISGWDVGKVTSMYYMFYNCTSFNQDLSSMIFKSTVSRSGYDQGATAWNTAYRPKFTG